MILDIYTRIKRIGLAKSQLEFSRVWLGRSQRYYSHLVASGREPGVGTLVGLHWRLSNCADNLPANASRAQLHALCDELQAHIKTKAVTRIRHRSYRSTPVTDSAP